MAYSSGMMNERVTVLLPVRQNGTVGARVAYRKGRTLWAAVTWSKGVRALRNGEVTAYDTVMVRTRWTHEITKQCRLLHDGKFYVIDSLNASRRENTVQITATEVGGHEVLVDG